MEWLETLGQTGRPHNMRLIMTAYQGLKRDQARVQQLAHVAVVRSAEVAVELVEHLHILRNLL